MNSASVIQRKYARIKKVSTLNADSATIAANISLEIFGVGMARAKTATKRKKAPKQRSFSISLKEAQRRLPVAKKELAEAMHWTAMLRAEIPSLENIIRALGGHVEGKATLPVFDLETALQHAPAKPLWKEPDMNGVASIAPGPTEGPQLPNLGSDEEWK